MTPQEKKLFYATGRITTLQMTRDYKVNELKARLGSLISSLQRSLEDVEAGKAGRLNSLGIIQGSGQEIDRLVTEISEEGKAIETMKGIVHDLTTDEN